MKWRRTVLLVLLGAGVVTGLLLGGAGATTWLAYRALATGEFAATSRYLTLANPLVRLLAAVTLDRSQTVKCWQRGLAGISLASNLPTQIQLMGDSYRQNGIIELQTLPPLIDQAGSVAQDLSDCLATNTIAQRLLPAATRDIARARLHQVQNVAAALKPLLSRNQTWVVMFQNTDELRPTGGFTGSYALIELRDQKAQLLAVEDIYDADGQVQRFRDAPEGIREYTSGDRGLRLPDANWWPDFPTSAQAQLDFLAEAGRDNLVGLVSVNLTLLQDVLRIVGPLPLPDYQTTLTAQNAPELLRSHAAGFFAGSREKKQLIQYAVKQLQAALTHTTDSQRQQLAALLLSAATNKELQIFSTNPKQQEALAALGVSGALPDNGTPVLALVEANVGINKSSRFISRAISLMPGTGDELRVTLYLTDTADAVDPALPASQSGYVNYQRVIVSPGLQITSIASTTNPQLPTTKTSWTSQAGTPYAEEGFLVTILPGQAATITVRLKRVDARRPILLWHQSGTGNTPLTTLTPSGEVQTQEFARDAVLSL